MKQQEIEQKYEVIIHSSDLLAIMVNSRDPELALPFNMPMVTYQLGSNSTGQQRVLGYLVDTNGDIDFPDPWKDPCGGADPYAVDGAGEEQADRRGSDQGPDRDGTVPEL